MVEIILLPESQNYKVLESAGIATAKFAPGPA